MSEPKDPARMSVTLTVGELSEIIEGAVKRALEANAKRVEKDWIKASELAKLYGLPQTWFEERGRAGDIERSKPGRYVLFKRADVEAYLEKNKRNGG
jgi:excisionase family DNA binding protein